LAPPFIDGNPEAIYYTPLRDDYKCPPADTQR